MSRAEALPDLRFPEFSEPFRETTIGNLADVTSGGTPSRNNREYWDGGIHWVTTSEIKNGRIMSSGQKISELGLRNSSAKVFPIGTVLLAMYGQGQTRGRTAILGIEATTNQACAALLVRPTTSPEFLFQSLCGRYDELRDLANDGSQKNLSGGLIKSLPISAPSLPEQQKIADFLGAVDARVGLLRRRRDALRAYKKGMMQRMFSQELRFTKPDGSPFPDWQEKRLGEVLIEHGERSSGAERVHSVSVHKGVIDQIEHLGRSFSAANTDHYGLVKPGDVIYTKSPTGDFPFGIIKQSRLSENVIVSPLYGVFSPETNALGYILNEHFLSVKNTHNYLHQLVQKGAKNTINIKNQGFLQGKLTLPNDPEEQQKIANTLAALDTKIDAVTAQMDAMLRFKKGLLQQMFV